ncbi:MAG: hypothetical protein PVG32_20115, partial [Anaerolineales bacterium]
LDKVADRLEGHEIKLKASPDAIDILAELGYNPEMGARPLRRVIQQKIEDKLSDALLSGEFEEGDTIQVDTESTTEDEEPEIILRSSEDNSSDDDNGEPSESEAEEMIAAA